MNISVLIGSCDEYYPLWKNFDILFKRYWEIPTKNYFVTETLEFKNENYIPILAGKVKWGQRILTALENIDTKYVFFILEDYYLSEKFTSKFIDEHISILEEKNADKIMFEINYWEYSLENVEGNLFKFKNNSQYLNSVQPSIWRTDYLKKVLKSNYSPWDFELEGNKYTQTLNPNILIRVIPQRMYFNFARKGGILSDGWSEFLIKEKLI